MSRYFLRYVQGYLCKCNTGTPYYMHFPHSPAPALFKLSSIIIIDIKSWLPSPISLFLTPDRMPNSMLLKCRKTVTPTMQYPIAFSLLMLTITKHVAGTQMLISTLNPKKM
ncbi:uncharacterized protein K444DRAFT_133296 [Hyaloscypha bicolor E]|uniref:Uncharacterized protein n=1 Tax=Hyaloscypha bicolor E TaxID=1095630 RepID=A0A2J6ST95_9HELO|nr:uncharacterized protein K444DRAFT_133296 [Hyaloscypha bicolor E]PMD53994.1 hypothetical protein K444DRAFT_133296 [Hyaloscypha bicolor E]